MEFRGRGLDRWRRGRRRRIESITPGSLDLGQVITRSNALFNAARENRECPTDPTVITDGIIARSFPYRMPAATSASKSLACFNGTPTATLPPSSSTALTKTQASPTKTDFEICKDP